MSKDYSAASIQKLEGIKALQSSPGMYIGDLGTSGKCHLVYEGFSNAVDEAVAGYGNRITVTIGADGWVAVEDRGRGIPFDLMSDGHGAMVPAATLIIVTPHAGAKFQQGEDNAYASSGGLHGVGTTAIAAFSKVLELDSWRGGQHFHQVFLEGIPQDPTIEPCPKTKTGTRLRWIANDDIFQFGAHYDEELIIGRIKPAAYLNPGLRVVLSIQDQGESTPRVHEYYTEVGLQDYVRGMMIDTEGDEATPLFPEPIMIDGERDGVIVKGAILVSTENPGTTLHSYANSIRTRDGGTHESGLRFSLTRVINSQAAEILTTARQAAAAAKKAPKGKAGKNGKTPAKATASAIEFRPDTIQQGLYAVLSIKMGRPTFNGQTKDRLSSPEIDGITRSVAHQALTEWFATNPKAGQLWVRRIDIAQRARDEALHVEQMMKATERDKSVLIDRSISDKFVRCASKRPEECELMIVEGDSAGGSAVQARNAKTQSVLKLRGKPLNVSTVDMKRIAGNQELLTLMNVLECGFGSSLDLAKLRFHKIVIMSDADVDGAHIQCLLLTFFHKMMPQLLTAGHIYIAQPPLYSITYKKQVVWLRDDDEKDAFFKSHKDAANLEIKRYKGLGEMDPKQLRETTMDPERRTLIQVTMRDVEQANNLVYRLMESKDAAPRRIFLESLQSDEIEAALALEGVA